MKKLLLAGAATLLAAAAMPAHAAVVFGSAYVYTSSYGYAYASGSSASSGASDSDSAASLPAAPLEASSFTTATAVKKLVPQAIGTNGEDATATFVNAASGTVAFNGASSATVLNPTDTSAYAQGYGYSQFYYNFVIDSDYTLNFGYNNSSTSAYNYYSPYYQISGPTYNYAYMPSTGTGSFSTLLSAGTYQLAIYDNYYQDLASQSGLGANTAERQDLFNFTLTSAVPEPASWAIMLAGFAMIGGALRSRRGRKAAAAFA